MAVVGPETINVNAREKCDYVANAHLNFQPRWGINCASQSGAIATSWIRLLEQGRSTDTQDGLGEAPL